MGTRLQEAEKAAQEAKVSEEQAKVPSFLLLFLLPHPSIGPGEGNGGPSPARAVPGQIAPGVRAQGGSGASADH